MTPIKTRIEIINETAEFYGADPSRRALGEDGTCQYQTSDGENCAVGRCLIDPASAPPRLAAYTLFKEQTFGVLKPEYRIEDEQFWGDLQGSHDRSNFWTPTGLSEEGEKYLTELRKTYADT